MVVNTISEAKAQLSKLLERVQAGEEVILSKAGKPVAILVPYCEDRRPREPGALRGRIHIGEDFDRLPDDIAEAFGAGPQ